MVDLDKIDQDLVTEPPLTFNYTEEQLISCYTDGSDLPVPDIPCHNQNIERAVGNTTAAVKFAIGHDKQHALILKTNKSRAKLPTNATKKDFLAK